MIWNFLDVVANPDLYAARLEKNGELSVRSIAELIAKHANIIDLDAEREKRACQDQEQNGQGA
jgi:hypothetical protein